MYAGTTKSNSATCRQFFSANVCSRPGRATATVTCERMRTPLTPAVYRPLERSALATACHHRINSIGSNVDDRVDLFWRYDQWRREQDAVALHARDDAAFADRLRQPARHPRRARTPPRRPVATTSTAAMSPSPRTLPTLGGSPGARAPRSTGAPSPPLWQLSPHRRDCRLRSATAQAVGCAAFVQPIVNFASAGESRIA